MTPSTITQSTMMCTVDFRSQINVFRQMSGESVIRNDQFIARVEDEIDDLGVCKNIAHPQSGVNMKAYDLTQKQMILVGMRESKAVRKKVADWLESGINQQVSTGNPILDALVETQRQVTEQKQVQAAQSEKLEGQSRAIAEIKHKLEFSGCSNGFVPWAQLYNMYGGSFPKQRFKSILMLMGVDKERYHFTAEGGFQASGDSFRESQVKSAFNRFISGLIQVSPEFCQHKDFEIGRIRYKVKPSLALEAV